MTPSLESDLNQIRDDVAAVLAPANLRQLSLQVGHSWRQRALDPITTIHLFVLQILHRNAINPWDYLVDLLGQLAAQPGGIPEVGIVGRDDPLDPGRCRRRPGWGEAAVPEVAEQVVPGGPGVAPQPPEWRAGGERPHVGVRERSEGPAVPPQPAAEQLGLPEVGLDGEPGVPVAVEDREERSEPIGIRAGAEPLRDSRVSVR